MMAVAAAWSAGAASIEKANRANLTGTDHLGRMLVSYEEAGPEKKGKEIGLFYYLWHGAHGTEGPYDITKIEAADPEALSHPDSPLWPNPAFPPTESRERYEKDFLMHGCSEAYFGRPTEGRSWHHGHKDARKDSAHYGLYFQEQIDEALDPKNADASTGFSSTGDN